MVSLIQDSFKVSFKVLDFVRIYRKCPHSEFDTLQAIVLYLFFIVLIPVLAIIHLIVEETDLQVRTYNAMFLTQSAAFIIKIFPFIINNREIRECVNYFDNKLFYAMTNKDQQILKDCVSNCQRNAKLFLYVMSGAILTWIAKPLIFKMYKSYTMYKTPIDLWLPGMNTAEFNEISIVYCLLYLITSAASIYMSFAGTTVDPLLASLAFHASQQLKILQIHMRQLHKLGNMEEIYRQICFCVERHETIILFVKKYEKCFSFVVLSQLASGVFVVCFCCLQLSEIKPFSLDGNLTILYMSFILIQIYFYCYYGQQILNQILRRSYSLLTLLKNYNNV